MECDLSQLNQRSRSQRTLLIATLVILVTVDAVLGAAVPRNPRSVAETNSNTADMNEIKVCHSTTPCGWAVYIPFTRRVDYFMKNTCECPKDRECLRTDDDLSVSAYVYRCRTESENKPGDSA